VSNAVTQVQKTTFDFTRRRFRDVLKDAAGNDTAELAYAVEPRSFLVLETRLSFQATTTRSLASSCIGGTCARRKS
jgi:hypothetical protein